MFGRLRRKTRRQLYAGHVVGDLQDKADAGKIPLQLANGAEQGRGKPIELFEIVEIIEHPAENLARIIVEEIFCRGRAAY